MVVKILDEDAPLPTDAVTYFIDPSDDSWVEYVLGGITAMILKEVTGMDKEVDVRMALNLNIKIREGD